MAQQSLWKKFESCGTISYKCMAWMMCFAADLMSEQHMKNIRWHFRIVYLYI